MRSHLTGASARSWADAHRRMPLGIFSRLLLAGLVLALVGCGGGTPNSTASAPAPNVTMFLQDAPAGSIAAFSVDVASVSLATAGGQVVPLSSPGQAMELRHTQLAPTVAVEAFTAQSGTYSALSFSLANPQLTVLSSNGQILRLNNQTHPSATLSSGTVTVPLSLTVSDPGHVNLMLDFDVARSVSTDSNGNYVITPTINAGVLGSQTPTALHGALAMVVATFFNGPNLLSQVPINALGSGQASQQFFEVQLHDSGAAVPIAVDSRTVLDGALGSLSQLRMGQLIYLSANVQSDGTFLATSIAAGPPSLSQHYEGPVTGVHKDASGNVSFDVVVQD